MDALTLARFRAVSNLPTFATDLDILQGHASATVAQPSDLPFVRSVVNLLVKAYDLLQLLS